MSGKTEIALSSKIDSILKKRLEPYSFQVGILNDKAHFAAKGAKRLKKGGWGPKPALKNYAGGPVRQTGNVENGTMSSVSQSIRNFLGFNYLIKPFEQSTPARRLFTNQYFKTAFEGNKGGKNNKAIVNLLQAIVRNPILAGKYGSNSRITRKIKGFNRKLFDTGQFFKAIEAKVTYGRV